MFLYYAIVVISDIPSAVHEPWLLLISAMLVINTVFGAVVAYAFYNLRRWGRYVAIGFSLFYISVILGNEIVSYMVFRGRGIGSMTSIALEALSIIGLMSLIIICLSPSIRATMTR
ncbi:MAG TPA: hypothetical protein VK066_06570 [Chloroflexota bacterium]|nr:hypothetical protein [Chloroflexota bacterium]